MSRRTLTLHKSGQTFLFRYTAGSEEAIVDELVRLAHEPSCPLDWADVATLSFQVAYYSATDGNAAVSPEIN